jgi:hypothetical protein
MIFYRSFETLKIINIKVEKIIKGSLDSVPSPSMEIQIMVGKVCLKCEDKTLHCWALFYFITSNKSFTNYFNFY